ncbi:PREDICTED: transcription initiation factor TFIID subunit 4-like [Ficedula albicollis]|uniref:transcription initiation factor TFIID subunit 4-like n=1 Tax=Ficedula albicollis TaxID=59894 RepID=UPI00035A1588|nr:PREDICTED: transcription initiation factor TFIID subunit 4-like [Ficedula albicollis]
MAEQAAALHAVLAPFAAAHAGQPALAAAVLGQLQAVAGPAAGAGPSPAAGPPAGARQQAPPAAGGEAVPPSTQPSASGPTRPEAPVSLSASPRTPPNPSPFPGPRPASLTKDGTTAPVSASEPFSSMPAAAVSSPARQGPPSSLQRCAADAGRQQPPLPRRSFASESRHCSDPMASPRSKLWMLPPCSVTARLKNRCSLWEAVKLRALQQGDWDLLERVGMPKAADETLLPRAKVFVQDLTRNKWEGPRELIIWGRRYACVSMDTGVPWLPARCVCPDLCHQRQNVADAQPSNADQHANHQPDSPSTGRLVDTAEGLGKFQPGLFSGSELLSQAMRLSQLRPGFLLRMIAFLQIERN